MAKNNRNWTTMYENNNQTLMVDKDSGSDYIKPNAPDGELKFLFVVLYV